MMKYTMDQRKAIIDRLMQSNKPLLCTIQNAEWYLSSQVLVPHPHTLHLIELAAAYISSHPEVTRIADVGTGTGIIAVSLAKRFPEKHFYASDANRAALELARQNSTLHAVENVSVLHNSSGRWMDEYVSTPLDCVISNPPFVGTDEYNSPEFQQNFPEVLVEPPEAIRTEDREGLNPYIEILDYCGAHAIPHIFFQCNSLATTKIQQYAASLPGFFSSTIHADSSGAPRFLEIHITPSNQ